MLLPPLSVAEKYYYAYSEPHFSSPIFGSYTSLSLRSDSYGKGYFGASRNGGRAHKGIDLAVPVGEPIVAARSGRVIFSGEEKGYGKTIEIKHPDGLISCYAHLSGLDAAQDGWVERGQLIGRSGKTGNAAHPSIKPHLHFEIKSQGQSVNPMSGFLDPAIAIKN